MASITALFNHPSAAEAWANTPPKDTGLQKVKDEVRAIFQRPSNGRTTRLGRKVEKPGDAGAAGPSGQHESTKHNTVHTNK
jgi:hypothetical protein